jgi:proteasome accessory factor B
VTAIHNTRLERLKRLERLLPRGTASVQSCLEGARLLAILGDAYVGENEKARRRALQRDLDELVKAGRIEAANPGGKPLRYRRLLEEPDDDPAVWQYTLKQIRDLVAEAVPARRLDRLWQRLLTEIDEPMLDETRVRILPDTLRLQPVELYPEVLGAVIEALAKQRVLKVLYEDARLVRGEAVLHPQALIQRGPIPYLFALKNDESEPVRLYALHRMIRAEALMQVCARAADGFDLDRAIAGGQADFGQGDTIVECLEPGQTHPVIFFDRAARCFPVHGMRDGADMIGRAPAAAADDVEEPRLRPLLDLLGHLIRRHVVTAHLVGQPGVRMKGGVGLGDTRHILDMRSEQIRAQGAVESDREGLDVAKAVVKGFDGLAGEGAPGGVRNRARDHDRQDDAVFLEDLIDRERGGLGVERVEDGLDQDDVDIRGDERSGRLGIDLDKLVEIRVACARVVDVRRDAGGLAGRA